MKRKVCLLAFLLLLPSLLAVAAPSTKGSTGNIETPSADVLRPGQTAIGYYTLDGEKGMSGAISAGKNIEVSAVCTEGGGMDDFTKVNIKYALAQEGVLVPGLAVGIEDIGDRSERTAYVVASKSLPQGFRLHIGGGNGNYDGVFFAIEKKLVPLSVGGAFPDSSLVVENNGHHMNYGLRMSLSPGLKMTTGWREGDPFIAFSYNYY
jgi:hypothetical protein